MPHPSQHIAPSFSILSSLWVYHPPLFVLPSPSDPHLCCPLWSPPFLILYCSPSCHVHVSFFLHFVQTSYSLSFLASPAHFIPLLILFSCSSSHVHFVLPLLTSQLVFPFSLDISTPFLKLHPCPQFSFPFFLHFEPTCSFPSFCYTAFLPKYVYFHFKLPSAQVSDVISIFTKPILLVNYSLLKAPLHCIFQGHLTHSLKQTTNQLSCLMRI